MCQGQAITATGGRNGGHFLHDT